VDPSENGDGDVAGWTDETNGGVDGADRVDE